MTESRTSEFNARDRRSWLIAGFYRVITFYSGPFGSVAGTTSGCRPLPTPQEPLMPHLRWGPMLGGDRSNGDFREPIKPKPTVLKCLGIIDDCLNLKNDIFWFYKHEQHNIASQIASICGGLLRQGTNVSRPKQLHERSLYASSSSLPHNIHAHTETKMVIRVCQSANLGT